LFEPAQRSLMIADHLRVLRDRIAKRNRNPSMPR